MSSIDFVRERLAELDEERARLRTRLVGIEAAISELWNVLKAMREGKEGKQPSASASSVTTSHEENGQSGRQPARRMKPSEAVMAYVAGRPEGVAQIKVVEDLEDSVVTDSTNRKRLIYNTIYTLKKSGKLVGFKNTEGKEAVRVR